MKGNRHDPCHPKSRSDCGLCNQSEAMNRCVALCKRNNVQCKRSSIPGTKFCHQHRKVHFFQNGGILKDSKHKATNTLARTLTSSKRTSGSKTIEPYTLINKRLNRCKGVNSQDNLNMKWKLTKVQFERMYFKHYAVLSETGSKERTRFLHELEYAERVMQTCTNNVRRTGVPVTNPVITDPIYLEPNISEHDCNQLDTQEKLHLQWNKLLLEYNTKYRKHEKIYTSNRFELDLFLRRYYIFRLMIQTCCSKNRWKLPNTFNNYQPWETVQKI